MAFSQDREFGAGSGERGEIKKIMTLASKQFIHYPLIPKT
jgi:hypothetical protein